MCALHCSSNLWLSTLSKGHPWDLSVQNQCAIQQFRSIIGLSNKVRAKRDFYNNISIQPFISLRYIFSWVSNRALVSFTKSFLLLSHSNTVLQMKSTLKDCVMYFFIYFLIIMQFEPILQKSFLVFNHREKIVKMRRRLYVVRVGCISERRVTP